MTPEASLLRRFSESGWGIRNIEGVGHPNDPENRTRVIKLAALVGASLGGVAVVSFVANLAAGVSIAEYRPAQVLLIPACGAALALVVYALASRLPLWFVHAGALFLNIALLTTAYFGGEIFVFALTPYIVVGTVLAMICRPGPLIVHLVLIGLSNGFVIIVRSDSGRNEPSTWLAGFVVLMGMLTISAGVGAWVVGRVRVLAQREYTARHDAERARAELEVVSGHKTAFLANMSHELRTPLNAIIGFADVLDEGMAGDLNAKQREYVQDIRGSGRHLLELINDVLDLAKIEAGRLDLEVRSVFLPAALEEWTRVMRKRADEKGVALTLEVSPDVGVIEADERKIRQVVFNVLSNAVKFTSAGGRIDVRAQTCDGGVEVTVVDTGVGIAPGDQDRIFEEFARADGSREEGTGLGLALSRRFVELHGGRLWVRSVLGEGSTFGFTIPLRAGAEARARRDSNPQPAG